MLKKIFIIACVFLLLLIITPIIGIPIANNIRLYSIESKIVNSKMPENTEMLEKQSICGKLNGNGNGMNYLATILIKSDLSIENLEKHFFNYNVIKQENKKFTDSILEHGAIEYTRVSNEKDFTKYYVVYSYSAADFGTIWEYDIRAH